MKITSLTPTRWLCLALGLCFCGQIPSHAAKPKPKAKAAHGKRLPLLPMPVKVRGPKVVPTEAVAQAGEVLLYNGLMPAQSGVTGQRLGRRPWRVFHGYRTCE